MPDRASLHPARTTRRAFCAAGGLAVAVTAAGCNLDPKAPPGRRSGQPAGGTDSPVREAPALSDRVVRGDLPKLTERLPQEPLVVKPVQRVGRYGGRWHTVFSGAADTAWMTRTIGYDPLVRYVRNWRGAAGAKEVIPNIASSYHIDSSGRVFTFTLRKGMRWSDGKPFTSADLQFAYEDVFLNTDLYPAPPTLFLSAGKAARIEAPDPQTVRFSFDSPNGLFLSLLASVNGISLVNFPKHHLKKFHKLYNPDADQLAKDAGFDGWVQLFQARSQQFANPDLPTLAAWSVSNSLSKSQVVATRNPYYFKVDTENAQLPYLDDVAYKVVTDVETMVLMASRGDIDMGTRTFNTLQNKPVLARNREGGGYHFIDLISSNMNTLVIMLNLNHKDPTKRAIFNNRDFRIGLSYALNRQEIIDTVYQRQGEPWQCAPRPESVFYDKEFAKQYTDHDVAEANRHLDRAGLEQRNGDGWRLGPDGQPLAFDIDIATGLSPEWPDAMELVKAYWKKVGVDVQLKVEDRSLYEERIAAGEHEASVWQGGGGLDVIVNYSWYFPNDSDIDYAPKWGEWYVTGGASGEKPPPVTRRQMELYGKLATEVEAGKQEELMKQILAISREQFYCLGINLTPPSYGVVRNDFHNLPKTMPDAWTYPTPGPTDPAQYFHEQA